MGDDHSKEVQGEPQATPAGWEDPQTSGAPPLSDPDQRTPEDDSMAQLAQLEQDDALADAQWSRRAQAHDEARREFEAQRRRRRETIGSLRRQAAAAGSVAAGSARSIRSEELMELRKEMMELQQQRAADQARIEALEAERGQARTYGTSLLTLGGPTVGKKAAPAPRPSTHVPFSLGQQLPADDNMAPKSPTQPTLPTTTKRRGGVLPVLSSRDGANSPPTFPPLATPYGQWKQTIARQGPIQAPARVSAGQGPTKAAPLAANFGIPQPTDAGNHTDSAHDPSPLAQTASTQQRWQQGRWRHPPKAKDIGLFDPDDETHTSARAYLWWQRVEHVVVLTGWSKEDILPVLMNCMRGRASEWILTTQPIPITWAEWRKSFLNEFVCDVSEAQKQLWERVFRPEEEQITAYLHAKYSLVGQFQIATALDRGLLDDDTITIKYALDAVSIRDLIFYAHQGLPPQWQLDTSDIKAVATSWSGYRSMMRQKEALVRRAHADRQKVKDPARNRQSTVAIRSQPDNKKATGPWTPTPPAAQASSPDDEARKTKARDRADGNCFLCHKPGHYGRDCPNDPERAAAVRQGERRAVRRAVAQLKDGWGAEDSDDDDGSREDGDEDAASPLRVRRVQFASVEDEDVDGGEAMVRDAANDLPGARFRSSPSGKLSVWVDGSLARHDICPDSGADLSTISERTLAALAPSAVRLPPVPVNIHGYQGGVAQAPSAVVRLMLHFCSSKGVKISKEAEFHVVRDCADGWLLGADNLAHFGFNVNMRDRCVTLADEPDVCIPLRDGSCVDPAARLLLVERATVVPANTCMLIPVLAPQQEATLEPYLFAHEDEPDGQVAAGRGLIGPSTRAVLITNASSRPVQLLANEALGELQSIERVLGTATTPAEAMTVAAVHETLCRLEREHTRRLIAEWDVLPKLRRWEQEEAVHAQSVRAIRLGRPDARISFGDDPDQDDALPEADLPTPSSTRQRVTVAAALSEQQRRALAEVLTSVAVWPTPSRPIGLYNGGEMQLKLKEEHQSWAHAEPPRRTSPAQRRAIDETLAEHDKLGISEPGSGPFAFGVVLVKQRGKIRFCNDYRPLNKVCVDDVYPMPTNDDVFDALGDARFFTTVDMNKGYHQVGIAVDSRDLTGFITFRGLRRYSRMPFGLKGAPSFFQRLIDRVLGAARWKFALAYLDDVVIFSATFEEHLQHVGSVLRSIEAAGLTVSPSKCFFAFSSIALLGYKVSYLGLRTDEEKTRAVTDFPVPRSRAEVKRFYAMAGWYRRFLPDFARRARPLADICKVSDAKEPMHWTAVEQSAFEDVKQAISSAPVLRRPDFTHPFILSVDASATGFGAVLAQRDEKGDEHPVLFLSRQTRDGERKLPATHLELCALHWCLGKLKHYVDGQELEVRTDHRALLWLWELKSNELTARLDKLKLALAPLEGKVRIVHKEGGLNCVADALSRAPVREPDEGEGEATLEFEAREYGQEFVRSVSIATTSPVADLDPGADWSDAYAADPHWRTTWSRLSENGTAAPFSLEGGRVWIDMTDGRRLCVPATYVPSVLKEYHSSIRAAHPGVHATLELIKRHMFFHDMRKTIKTFVESCYECQANKTRRQRRHGLLEPIREPHETWHTLGQDFVTGVPTTPAGFDAITVVSDKFSKFAFFYPSQKKDDARATAQRFLQHVFPVTGLPRKVLSDRDARFTSTFWRQVFQALQITRGMSTPYHPQTDGQVERLNETLCSMLRHFVSIRQDDWDLKLPILALAYNNRKHASTSFSPYELVFGQHPHLLALEPAMQPDGGPDSSTWVDDLRAARAEAGQVLELSAARQKFWYDAKHKDVSFRVGDMVMVSLKHYHAPIDSAAEARKKLAAKYAGPFAVTEVIGSRAYRLKLPGWFRAHDVFPVDALVPFRGDATTAHPRPLLGLSEGDDDTAPEEQVIRRFVGRRPTLFTDGIRFDYLVEWASDTPSWQQDSRLPHLQWAIKDFEREARANLGKARLPATSRLILPGYELTAQEADAEEGAESDGTTASTSALADAGTGKGGRCEE